MGKIKRTKGSLQINGIEDEAFQYKKLTGYVPQDDIMLRELTVRENIAFSAKIRLPRNWTKQQVDNHVNAVIDALGLDNVQDVLIGDEVKRGISGGQRKRVNIGMELAACPLALFLVGHEE
jgi:ABC-type multidrug transport system ATPase subunit